MTSCRICGCTVLVGLLGLALAPSTLRAQSTKSEGAAARPISDFQIDAVLVPDGPRIDGVLDDPVWSSASVIDDFTQQEPNEGAPATERTEVRVLYDGSTLFLGVRAFDSSPGGPIATEMRRDADRILDEDNFQVILDTFKDARSGYMFVVSPLGAQLDQQISDDGGQDRMSRARATNREWDGVWAVSATTTEEGWVAEIAIPMVTVRFPPGEPQSWGVNFKRNIRNKNEEVVWAPIPRAFDITRVSLAGQMNGLQSLNRGLDLRVKPYATGGGRWKRNAGAYDNQHTQDVGLDVKYGVLPGLNLDVTVNTDFAQAEVDNEQVNLTRFALFYPEKREFFLENAGMFEVGTTSSVGRIADLFFSRRIGLTESRSTVPIIGGARLTGKVGSNNIAVMDIQTQSLKADDGSVTEAGQNFLVTRLSRDVFGRSRIGGLFINKDASTGGAYNRTYAADATFSIRPELTLEGFVAATQTPGLSGDAMATHIRSAWQSEFVRVYGERTDLGDNFNPEVGFAPRVGVTRTKIHLEVNPRPGRWGIRVLQPMWEITEFQDQSGRKVSREFHYMVGTQFQNGAFLNVMYNNELEVLDAPFNVATGIAVDPGRYHFWNLNLMFRSNPARRLSYNVRYGPQTFWDGDRVDWGGGLTLRVTNQLATSGSFSRSVVDLPAGSFTADIASLQLDYGFSPRLSLRTLTQYNSYTDQLSTSARLRYTYRPGSDIYVVYDDVRRDLDNLVSPFSAVSRDSQLIVKVTYLLTM